MNENHGNFDSNKYDNLKNIYLIFPWWFTIFFIIGGIVLLIVGLSVRFLTGLSSSSDVVFAIEALIACFITDVIFKKAFKRKLVLAPKLEIPAFFFYLVVCLYILFFLPLQ